MVRANRKRKLVPWQGPVGHFRFLPGIHLTAGTKRQTSVLQGRYPTYFQEHSFGSREGDDFNNRLP